MKRSQDVDFDALFDSLNTGESTWSDDDESPAADADDEVDDDDED